MSVQDVERTLSADETHAVGPACRLCGGKTMIYTIVPSLTESGHSEATYRCERCCAYTKWMSDLP
jgi:hypothetical protein